MYQIHQYLVVTLQSPYTRVIQLILSEVGFLSRCNNLISVLCCGDKFSAPSTTCMLHRPQTLSALQDEATGRSACLAASKSNVPEGTSQVFPEGKKVTMGMCDNIAKRSQWACATISPLGYNYLKRFSHTSHSVSK